MRAAIISLRPKAGAAAGSGAEATAWGWPVRRRAGGRAKGARAGASEGAGILRAVAGTRPRTERLKCVQRLVLVCMCTDEGAGERRHPKGASGRTGLPGRPRPLSRVSHLVPRRDTLGAMHRSPGAPALLTRSPAVPHLPFMPACRCAFHEGVCGSRRHATSLDEFP